MWVSLYGSYYGPADDTDLQLAAQRQSARETLENHCGGFNPLCGDVVIFPGGERLRISYVWDADGGPRIQTSHGGSWYWSASGDMDFSGGLLVAIPGDTLTETGERAEVSAWIFHHDLASAHRGVSIVASVKVWKTTADLPAG